MRLKGLGGCTTSNGVEDGSFYLDETVVLEETADISDDPIEWG